MASWILLLLVVALLALSSTTVSAQETNATTGTGDGGGGGIDVVAESDTATVTSTTTSEGEECPTNRWYDFDHPNKRIYGAPNGCRCLPGLSELHCGYCDVDFPIEPCQDGLSCRSGFRYVEGDTTKSYKCRLSEEFETLFPKGKAAMLFDLEGGASDVVIYNSRTLDSVNFHLMRCTMRECQFDMEGGSGANCGVGTCWCTERCADWFRDIVDRLNNLPAQIVVEDAMDSDTTASEEREVKIIVGDQTIGATCTASACTSVSDPDWATYDAIQEVKNPSGGRSTETTGTTAIRLLLISWLVALQLS